MDNDERPPPTKLRFKPRAPPKKITPGRVIPSRSEPALIHPHLRRLAEKHEPKEAKIENPSSEQVSSGHGSTSTDSIRTNGAPTAETSGKSSGSRKKGAISGGKQKPITMSSTVEADDTVFLYTEEEEEYEEPFMFVQDNGSIYPITLPMRPPYSGDPELLDEVEFGDHSKNMHPIIDEDYKDPITNPALDLGLQECEGHKMFLVQLPTPMPFVSRPSAKVKENVGNETPKEGCKFETLPEGTLGKMLVYKSGAVKFKVGEGDNAILFDMDSGENNMPVEAVAINTNQHKHYCVLGDIERKMIIKLHIDE